MEKESNFVSAVLYLHNAEETAIANGLLENARSNAETILKGFFTKAYDLDKYTLTFE